MFNAGAYALFRVHLQPKALKSVLVLNITVWEVSVPPLDKTHLFSDSITLSWSSKNILAGP